MENRIEIDPNQYSPLVLAYIGDACYELYVRERLVREGNCGVNQIHRRSVGFVRAKAQCASLRALEEILTDEERSIVRRGRNTKSAVPKNADVSDYRHATGFEAMLGYLYIKGERDRLIQLMTKAADALESE